MSPDNAGGVRIRVHPSGHYEIRLSLAQLCGVNKAPLQLLRSVHSVCAALIRRK